MPETADGQSPRPQTSGTSPRPEPAARDGDDGASQSTRSETESESTLMQPEPDNVETSVTAALRAVLASACEAASVLALRANSETALRRAHTRLEGELYAALQQLLLNAS